MSLSRLGSFHANEHIEVSNLQSIFVLFLAYKNKLLQKFRNVLIIHYQSIMIVSVLYYTTDRRTCLSYNVSHLLLSLLVCELEFKLQAMNLIKSLTAPVDLHYTLKFSSYLRQNIGFNSHNYQQVNYILWNGGYLRWQNCSLSVQAKCTVSKGRGKCYVSLTMVL
jgi:hypothetical protein